MPPMGARSGQADLRPDQLQDLADKVATILRHAAAYEVKFTVILRVVGENAVEQSVVDAINAVLRDIDPDFQVR
jgi:hypothetical protein